MNLKEIFDNPPGGEPMLYPWPTRLPEGEIMPLTTVGTLHYTHIMEKVTSGKNVDVV